MEFDRLRRIRKKKFLRELVSEVSLTKNDLILPYFVVDGNNRKEKVYSIPGVFRFSKDKLLRDLEESLNLGVRGILLFGVLDEKPKDNLDKECYDKSGIVQKAIMKIKKEFPEIVIITDVCLCAYTRHGHCGIFENNRLDNDKTLKILSKIALSHAEAGADIVSPSAMMDGQVLKIREELDKNGFKDTLIMGYSAKFASYFYAPFRDIARSSPLFSDRKTYQVDYRNLREALREIDADVKEGADIIMVKPALSYLDVIREVRNRFSLPLAAYNVSGEYSMLNFYFERMKMSEKDRINMILEVLLSIKRAGADMIITYFAKEISKYI